MKIEKTNYEGLFQGYLGNRKILLTKNLTPGLAFFDEKLIKEDNIEYRELNPSRSKFAAAAIKRISFDPIKEGSKILYLGASHGYTPSFLSDIVKNSGVIFCLDFAQRVVRDLLFICEKRENMIPILADAKKPETYKNRIETVDVIYQDVAQKNQVEILFKNLQFLSNKGYILIAIKARSIDSTRHPSKIFREVEDMLKEKLKIIDKKELAPFEKDHIFFVCQKR